MVFRRQMSNYLHPVNTVKHVVDFQGGVVAAAKTTVILIQGVEQPTLAGTAGVNPGAHVRSIFLNIQVAATGTAALANIYMMVYRNVSNAVIAGNIPNANVVGSSDMKKSVFHQEMTMTEKNTTAISRTLFKGVLKIPKHMARIGFDDTINVQLFAPGINFDVCIQCIYKEIR